MARSERFVTLAQDVHNEGQNPVHGFNSVKITIIGLEGFESLYHKIT